MFSRSIQFKGVAFCGDIDEEDIEGAGNSCTVHISPTPDRMHAARSSKWRATRSSGPGPRHVILRALVAQTARAPSPLILPLALPLRRRRHVLVDHVFGCATLSSSLFLVHSRQRPYWLAEEGISDTKTGSVRNTNVLCALLAKIDVASVIGEKSQLISCMPWSHCRKQVQNLHSSPFE